MRKVFFLFLASIATIISVSAQSTLSSPAKSYQDDKAFPKKGDAMARKIYNL